MEEKNLTINSMIEKMISWTEKEIGNQKYIGWISITRVLKEKNHDG